MSTIACTEPFFPRENEDVAQRLVEWNLTEDLGVRQEADGRISVYAQAGATSWPYEWTPQGDDLFEEFEIAQFLVQVAQAGQSVKTHDSQGARQIYVSAR